MSMMKKFNNLFVNEDDFEDEVVEREEVRQEQPKQRVVKRRIQCKVKQMYKVNRQEEQIM